MDTFLFLSLAYLGGWLGIKLRLPAGALLGSMFLIGTFNMFHLVYLIDISPFLRIGVQIALGTMIGLQFSGKFLELKQKEFFSLLIVGIASMIFSLLFGTIFYWFSKESFITALIAMTPGGIAEMLTLADSIHANTEVVAIMHVIRVVILMVIMRWLIRFVQKKLVKTKNA